MGMGSLVLADRLQHGAACVEDRDDARLRGDVEPAPAGVKGEDVWTATHRVRRGHRHRLQVNDQEGGALLARDESLPPRCIDQEAVWRLAASIQVIATDEAISGGVDDGELVLILDGDENATGTGVEMGIAGLSADIDGRHHVVGGGVDDELPTTGFIGDKHLLDRRSVVETIREADLARVGDDLQVLRVNDGNIATPGRGGKDATELRYSQHTRWGLNVAYGADDLLSCGVDDHDLVGTHVGDDEPARRLVETLVIEARNTPRQG